MNFINLFSKGLIFSLSTSFLWALFLVNSRYVLKSGEDPLNLVIWSNLIGLLLWLPLNKRHYGEYLGHSRKNKLMLLVIGITGSIGLNLLQSLALKNTTAVNFAFLYRTIVVFTIILAWVFFKEKITKPKIVLAAVILIGSYFLTTSGRGLVLTKGDMYTLLMALSAAFIANILIKHTISKMHPDLSASAIAIVIIISLMVLGILTQSIKIPKQMFWIAIGAVISFLQVRTRNRAYQNASASFVTMIVSLTPVFVSIFSLIFLGERLDGVQMIGGFMIVAAGFLVNKTKI